MTIQEEIKKKLEEERKAEQKIMMENAKRILGQVMPIYQKPIKKVDDFEE